MSTSSLNAYIYIGNRCNLKCSYCYINGDVDTVNTKENIDKYFDLLFADPYTKDRSKIRIDIIGGEPFIEMDLLEHTVESFIIKAKHYNHYWYTENKFKFTATTNGTLLGTKRVKDFLERYPFFSVSISIDGPEAEHNKNRIYKSNNCGSFKDVIAQYEWTKEKYNLDRADAVLSSNNIDELYKILLFQIIDLKSREIGVNIDCSNHFSRNDSLVILKNMKSIIEYLINSNREFVIRIATIMRSNVDHPVNPYNSRSQCGICDYTICLHPNGDIYPCHILASNNHRDIIIGNVNSGIDTAKTVSFLNKLKDSNCKKCRFNSICFKCVAQLYNEETGTFNKPTNICNLTKIGVVLTHSFINKIKLNIKDTVKFI